MLHANTIALRRPMQPFTPRDATNQKLTEKMPSQIQIINNAVDPPFCEASSFNQITSSQPGQSNL
jgi:hypothetical protein